MNLARLNHILIPTTKAKRDRIRRSGFGRLALPVAWGYSSLSDEGRFLFLFAVVAGFAGLDVQATQNHLLWGATFALILASLVLRPLFRLQGVRLEVEPPERVAVGEEVEISIVLVNDSDREYQAVRVVRPMLPWDGRWTSPRSGLDRLPARERRRLATRARFTARGRHHLDTFQASALVPLGLTVGKGVESNGARFTVVPRIASVRSVELPIGHRYQPGGVALASKTGESMELLGVRPYRFGDRIRDLHPRSWARIGDPVVREYQQEYFARLGVILDTDRTVSDEAQLEAAISLSAGIVARVSRGESLIDLLVTGDQLHPLALGRSLGFLEQALDHLACVEAGTALEASRLLALLEPYLERLSCVVLVVLSWDEERRALVDRIRSTGVGCRVILVSRESGIGGVTQVLPETIDGGEAILL